MDLKNDAKNIIIELITKAKLKSGDLLVIGCSSSEIVGGHIGKDSSPDAAGEVLEGIWDELESRGIKLCAQCCEHLNRALIIERDEAIKRGLEIVNVVPWVHAGGSFATAVYGKMKDPVAVEEVKADAGLDIGRTLIGMHLKKVAVPLRLSTDHLGDAIIIAARTRPKYIGGERAHYNEL